jgi:riboflavin synthase
MFTGIATEVVTLEITCSRVLPELFRGGSININGACLTVMKKDAVGFSIVLIPETFEKTSFRYMNDGDTVNLESAMKLGDPLVGGMVSGLVDGVGKVTSIISDKNKYEIDLEIPQELVKFVAPRTGIVINGIGLNTKTVHNNSITIALYPYVLAHTTLSSLNEGSFANLEVSSTARVIVHYLETTRI